MKTGYFKLNEAENEKRRRRGLEAAKASSGRRLAPGQLSVHEARAKGREEVKKQKKAREQAQPLEDVLPLETQKLWGTGTMEMPLLYSRNTNY